MRQLLLISLLFLITVSFAFAGGSGEGVAAENTFSILYTSSLNGNIDGCECKSGPKTGLVKRAHFLRSYDLQRSVLVDTGDIFDVLPDELLSDLILDREDWIQT